MFLLIFKPLTKNSNFPCLFSQFVKQSYSKLLIIPSSQTGSQLNYTQQNGSTQAPVNYGSLLSKTYIQTREYQNDLLRLSYFSLTPPLSTAPPTAGIDVPQKDKICYVSEILLSTHYIIDTGRLPKLNTRIVPVMLSTYLTKYSRLNLFVLHALILISELIMYIVCFRCFC